MKMRKKLASILLVLCLTALLCAGVFAEDSGFNAYFEVKEDGEDTIVVTVPEENDAILAAQKPTLTIPCDFDAAHVDFNGKTIESTLDTAAKTITFPVETHTHAYTHAYTHTNTDTHAYTHTHAYAYARAFSFSVCQTDG